MNLFLIKIRKIISLPYAILFFVTIAGYWQVAFGHYCLKCDMIDCYYPWRYFVGEILQQHLFPLWNPYAAFGQPICADPQSGAWYPFAWIIGYFHGYDIYFIAVEFILHIYLAGVGMFWLLKKLRMNKNIALIAAVSYLLSGFFIGNAQHLTYIISGAWLPFIIGSFFELHRRKDLYSSLRLALFAWLQVAGGYPAFTFILLYLLIFLFAGYSISDIFQKKDYIGYRKFFLFTACSSVATLLMSSVTLVSIAGAMPFLSRGAGVTFQAAQFCPVSPKALISFILPYSVVKDPTYFDSDISMMNSYMGLIIILFFFTALFTKHRKIFWFFAGFGFFCLLAAMGKYLPVRAFLYRYIPLMNLFRFPGLFRYFVILGFIIFASDTLQQFLQQPANHLKKIKIAAMTLSGILIIFVSYQILFGKLDIFYFWKNGIFKELKISTINEHILFHGIIQIIILGIFIFLLWKIKSITNIGCHFLWLVIADMWLSAQLSAPYTVFYSIPAKDVKAFSNNFPKGFSTPPATPIGKNTDQSKSGVIFWKNMSIFFKQIGKEGFTPFRFYGYEQLTDSFPIFLDSIITHSPVYLTDKIVPESSLRNDYLKHNFSPNNLYLTDNDFANYRLQKYIHTAGDTAYFSSFSPEQMEIRVKSKETQWLALLQSNFTNWKATVNGKKINPSTANLLFMAIPIPAGESEVVFHFDAKAVIIGFWVTVISIFCVITCFLLIYIHQNHFLL